MVSSFRKVDYSLRPAKHAERRMLCEIFRNLRPFQPVEDYVYVGFGSLWFSDFILFHRMLGIRDMVSIEKSSSAKGRFEANKPFNAIVMDYRDSSQALPAMNWDKRHFVWLDYDDPLTSSMLLDTCTVATQAKSGSIFSISVQCMQAPEIAEAAEADDGSTALSRFRAKFGDQRLSDALYEDDLIGWRYGNLIRSMIKNEIEAALAVRNSSSDHDDVVNFTPICEIEYEDGAKMTTLVGIFSSRRDQNLVDSCFFDKLDFLAHGKQLIRIGVPKLTIREIRLLEQLLPNIDKEKALAASIPEGEVNAFAKFYRYLPNFAVLES